MLTRAACNLVLLGLYVIVESPVSVKEWDAVKERNDSGEEDKVLTATVYMFLC